jgi:hypothetical protein
MSSPLEPGEKARAYTLADVEKSTLSFSPAPQNQLRTETSQGTARLSIY